MRTHNNQVYAVFELSFLWCNSPMVTGLKQLWVCHRKTLGEVVHLRGVRVWVLIKPPCTALISLQNFQWSSFTENKSTSLGKQNNFIYKKCYSVLFNISIRLWTGKRKISHEKMQGFCSALDPKWIKQSRCLADTLSSF